MNQFYKSSISDEVFNIIATEVSVKANSCGVLDNYCKFTNRHRKTLEDEYDIQIEDHRDINQVEKKQNMSTISLIN